MTTRSFSYVLLFCALAAPRGAAAEELGSGDVCELRASLRAAAGPGGGKGRVLAAGEQVTVLEVRGDRILVRYGSDLAGYLKTRALAKFCRLLTKGKAAPPPKAVAPAAPANPSDPVPAPTSETAASDPGAPASAVEPGTAGPAAPGKYKVAVMSLTGDESTEAELLASLTDVIPRTLEALGPFSAIASQDVVRLLQYRTSQQQLGCDDADCLSDIGDALGADYLVTGSLTQSEGAFVLQLQLMEIESGRVTERLQRQHVGARQTLFDVVGNATRILVRGLLALRSGMVSLSVSEEGASVKVDDTIVGITPVTTLTVAGGMHTLRVEKEGFVAFAADVDVQQNQLTPVAVHLIPSADFVAQYRADAELVRILSWVAITVGGASLATGLALIAAAEVESSNLNRDVAAFNAQPDRSSADYDSLGARQSQIALMDGFALGTVLLAVGATTTGLMLRWLGKDPDRYAAQTLVMPADPQPTLLVGPGGVGLQVRW